MSYQDLVPLVLIEIIGDFGYEHFANNGGVKPFMVGTLGYVATIYYLIRSLQGSSILVINVAWDAISAIIETLAAMFILREYPKDYSQFMGIVLIIAGLYFLKIPFFREKPFKFPSIF